MELAWLGRSNGNIAGLMLGMGPVEGARFAAAAAAISVTRAGAQPSMPAMAEVEQMIERANGGNGLGRAQARQILSEEPRTKQDEKPHES